MVALLTALAALVSSCSDSSNDGQVSKAAVETVASTIAGSEVIDSSLSDYETLDPADLANLEGDDLDPVSVRQEAMDDAPAQIDSITDRSVRLIEQLGVDGAFDALIYAFTRGYSDDALAAAVDRGDLRADGSIPDVTPTLNPGVLLQAPALAEGIAAPQDGRDGSPMGIEELRRTAQAFRIAAERKMEAWDAPETATAEGAAILNFVQALANAGLSADQIINAIVLGYGGMERRVAQVGMGPATVCRMVVIGGSAEPIANRSGCDRYAEVDARLRSIYAEREVEYPPCDSTSIEGFYDACAGPAEGGEIEDGTYSGVVDKASDFGQFFSDLEGVATVDVAEMVVGDGTVTAFELELSGTGASNFNVVSGERLCENPISITAKLNDTSGVEMGEGTAKVPVTFSFVQEIGSGAECFEESNVAFDESFEDIASIVFEGSSASATLTAGIGATMTRTE